MVPVAIPATTTFPRIAKSIIIAGEAAACVIIAERPWKTLRSLFRVAIVAATAFPRIAYAILIADHAAFCGVIADLPQRQ